MKKTERKASGVEERPPIEVPTDAVATEGSRRRFGLVAAAAVVVLVIGAAAAILTLSGDGGDDVVTASPATSGPITSFDDIAGTTYERQGPGGKRYLFFLEDGTVHSSSSPDLVEDRPSDVYTTRFDGTQVLLTTTSSRCPQPDQGGTYEIHLLENGNLQFVAIDEDPCGAGRSNFLQSGWAPVP